MLILMTNKNDVEEELEGAKKYFNEYTKSGDVSFKEMAGDELKHAGILIKKHLVNADEKTKAILNSYEKERQDWLKKVSNKEIE